MNHRSTAVKYAWTHLNSFYKWGGDDPSGWDCSGLVQEILAAVGLDPRGDQTADTLSIAFEKIDFYENGIQEGCLCFFGSAARVTHVGFSIGNGLMIEAGGGGSNTTSAAAAIRQNAYVRIRPISNRKDLVCVCDPFSSAE